MKLTKREKDLIAKALYIMEGQCYGDELYYNILYSYYRVWLYREYDIPFMLQVNMNIDIEPYTYPQRIHSLTWQAKVDQNNELIAWIETKEYGQKDCKKAKKKIKKGETTKSQSKFEADIKNFKSWGWIEEHRDKE